MKPKHLFIQILFLLQFSIHYGQEKLPASLNINLGFANHELEALNYELQYHKVFNIYDIFDYIYYYPFCSEESDYDFKSINNSLFVNLSYTFKSNSNWQLSPQIEYLHFKKQIITLNLPSVIGSYLDMDSAIDCQSFNFSIRPYIVEFSPMISYKVFRNFYLETSPGILFSVLNQEIIHIETTMPNYNWNLSQSKINSFGASFSCKIGARFLINLTDNAGLNISTYYRNGEIKSIGPVSIMKVGNTKSEDYPPVGKTDLDLSGFSIGIGFYLNINSDEVKL